MRNAAVNRAMDRRETRALRAFTLLELLVVLGIIALLATLVAPKFLSRLSASKPVVTRQQLGNAESAIEQFHLDVGRYPTTDEGLNALLEAKGVEKWKGPYLARKAIPKDGWGNPLQYRAPSTEAGYEFEVYSFGADNKQGGEGDNKDLFHWQAQ